MSASPRPLPAVVGRTENALRALLLGTLAGSRLDRYEQWAALNLIDGRTTAEDAVETVTGSLGIARDEAVLLLDDLVRRGLLQVASASYALAPDGAALLSTVRPVIAGTVRRLLAGLAPQDVETAVRVLDQVRARADRELADLTG